MDSSQARAALEDQLVGAGYNVSTATISGGEALVARRGEFRLAWAATQLHTFVVVFTSPDLDEATAERLTAAGQEYAISHKGGIPRGLQTGTATVAVLLAEGEMAALRPWFSRRPRHRFAALRFPVLAELDTGTLTYFRQTLRVGGVYSKHLHGVVENIIAPAVSPSEAGRGQPGATD